MPKLFKNFFKRIWNFPHLGRKIRTKNTEIDKLFRMSRFMYWVKKNLCKWVRQPVDEVKLKLLKVNSVHKSPINFTILPLLFLYSIVTTRNTLLKPSVIEFLSKEHCPCLTYFAISINFLSHFMYQLAKWVYLLYMHRHDS